MTEYDKDKYQYRFSGYPPPLIQLDSTGPAYWLKFYTHPYYINQPQYWQQPVYRYAGKHFRGNPGNTTEQPSSNQLYVQLPICRR